MALIGAVALIVIGPEKLPRVARTNLLASVSNNTALNAGSVTITAGNVQGGYAWLYVTSTINAYATAAGCPCEATVVVARGGVQVTSQMYMDIPALPAGDADSDEIATTSNVIIVPTGVPQTLSTVFQRTGGTAPVFMYGTLIAMVIPFGGDGQPPAVRAPLADDGIGTIVGKPEED